MAAGRRAVPVIAATVGSLALLSRFHTSPEPSAIVATVPTSGAPPSTSAPATTTTAPASRAPSTTTSEVTQATTGPVVMTRFGAVQVEIWRRAGRLVDVEAVRLPDSHARSVDISRFSAPRLRQEALQAQSAQIDIVSGATYTSIGYAQSLQGAINARR